MKLKDFLDYKDPLRKHKTHTFWGGIIFIITVTLLTILSEDKSLGLVLPLGLSATLGAGFLKEFIDGARNFKFDIGDIVATTLGGIFLSPLYIT